MDPIWLNRFIPIDPWIYLMERPTCSNWEVYGLLVIIPKTRMQLHLISGPICN